MEFISMEIVIERIEQVTPHWLSSVLRRQGVLTRGEVTRVTTGEAQATFASSVWRLEVETSHDATPGAPHWLFLKLSNPSLAPGAFDPAQQQREIIFYREVAPAMQAAFTIPCYSAVYAPESGAAHLLLKDVSATHAACLTPLQANVEGAVDAIARLHAFWWDHPRLGRDIGSFTTPEERRKDWDDTRRSTTAFTAALGDGLPAAWRATYERVLPALPVLFNRHVSRRNLTLVHGDAHLGNFLFPKDVPGGSALMLDWQFWHPTVGGTDLAFMLATDWEVETRRALEGGLLRRYHDGLLELGVKEYNWDACWDDYRLSVILVSIFIPVWRWAVFKWAPDLSALEKSMTAFDDLGCSELLAGGRLATDC
jgi:hypothetical protein